jgi:hypothetical protein
MAAVHEKKGAILSTHLSTDVRVKRTAFLRAKSTIKNLTVTATYRQLAAPEWASHLPIHVPFRTTH